MSSTTGLVGRIVQEESALLNAWMEAQMAAPTMRRDLIRQTELRDQSHRFLRHFARAIQSGLEESDGPAWEPVRDALAEVSRARALQGFTPTETAWFVLSLKHALFDLARGEAEAAPSAGALDELWRLMSLIDRLALFTSEAFMRSREEIINRQQREMLELSTPVVRLWDGILALPLIGTLDSSRTQIVMENLLEEIVRSEAAIAIIDITGVPTVDTLVAQHLLKTVAAARLMGADCIISGIRPQIAQTIVHLGVDLSAVITKSTLSDAFKLAMARCSYRITRQEPGAANHNGNPNPQDAPLRKI